MPRYLAGLGVIDEETVLIFGGHGNKEGNQEFSPHNYYDLFTYNVQTSETKKLWELDATQHNFVEANSLVVDTLQRCFYALCFPNQKFNAVLQLYRFSMDEPVYDILADSIPYPFNDNHSFADLYLTNDKRQLVAVTSYTDEKAAEAEIAIYTLSFPPMKSSELLQKHAKGNSLMWYIFLILAVLLLVYYGWNRRRKQLETRKNNVGQPVTATGVELMDMQDPVTGIRTIQEEITQPSICLFGGFQVIGKESRNVTGEFSPILKQLFLLILLYTLKDGKGISSFKLREILWYDKSEESAKNNRGVSLSKLRLIFEKIGGISISSQTSYWSVHFGNDIYCDYYEALVLMDRLAKVPDVRDIRRLAFITSAGELLPNLQADWVDTFKSDFSNKLIDLLLHLIAADTEQVLDTSLKINISDAIFAHDSLNEDALKLKCKLLVETGKNGLAQKIYASFVKEYQALFGAEFKYTFEQVIS